MADEIVAKMQTQDTTQTQGDIVGLVAGDMATKTYLMWTTTDGFETKPLSLDSIGQDFLESEDNKTYLVDAHVIIRNTAGVDSATCRLYGYVKRGVGAETMIAYQISSVYRSEDEAMNSEGVGVALTADTVTGAINIEVSGIVGLIIKWVARVMVTEVSTAL